MRSRRNAQNSTNVSLFPFLAVLLCTMGALIVILVVLSRQARLQAAQSAQNRQQPAELDEAEQREQEDLSWQIETMQSSQSQTEDELKRDRLALTHAENHLRDLREQWRQLGEVAQELKRSGSSTQAQRQQAEADLARLKQRVLELTQLIDKTRKANQSARPSYAIIPYEGPHRTRRRPLFIECRSDSVVLQPEGVVLDPDDFLEPLGPRNPLAWALRAADEYLTRGQAGAADQEPYPLLLVRPDGISAYYKAREAIESWGSSFGYELIGADWDLDFPPADPLLAQIEQRAVDEGRVYQLKMARAAPSRYSQRPKYRASPHRGGFIREGGGGFGGTHDAPAHRNANAARGSDSQGRDDRGTNQPAQHGGQNNAQRSVANANARQQAHQTHQAQRAQQAKGGAPGGTAQAGSTQATEGGSSTSSMGNTFGAAGGRRGRNWGLPNASPGAVPIRRPVRVIVSGDRLILLPERGLAGGKLVMLGPRTEDSIDEFVSELWKHMEPWGIAGNGLYWQPVLTLQIAPDGAGRAADMRRLLERSGLETRDDTTTR